MVDTTILVPTYFGNQMTINCIGSILAWVPNAKILVYKNDIGWLKACNTLVESLSTDIILLNDDTYLLSNIVQEMQTLAYSDNKIGIVGGKALEPKQQHVINYGIYIAPDGNTAHKHYGAFRDTPLEVEEQRAVEGSCMYIKREVINNIGLFDEGYGMGYREELDLCFRAREAGYRVVSCPTAEYIHFTSQTNSKVGIHNTTYDYFMSKWGRKLKLGQI